MIRQCFDRINIKSPSAYIFVHYRNVPVGYNGIQILGLGSQESPEGSSMHSGVVSLLVTGIVSSSQSTKLTSLRVIQGIHVQLK